MRRIVILVFVLLTAACLAQEPAPTPAATPVAEATAEPLPEDRPAPEESPTPLVSPTPGAEKEILRVGVTGTRPFVVPVGKDLEGLSVETWRALAKELDYDFRLERVETIAELLDGVHDGTYDVAVGPISITSERSIKVAFMQPYFDSSLGILSLNQAGDGRLKFQFHLQDMLFGAGGLMLVLVLVGGVCWLLERKANSEQFPEDPVSGVGNGMWMALVTMTTVGYGDKAPVTLGGRIFTGAWMLIATVTLSSFTAWIATSLTVSQLEVKGVSRPSDLSGLRVAVIRGTTSEVFARHYQVREVAVQDHSEGIEKLQRSEVEAVVYDHPILLYHLQQNPMLPVSLAPSTFASQDYGFALRKDDPRLHRFNVGLLRLAESGVLRDIRRRWLRE